MSSLARTTLVACAVCIGLTVSGTSLAEVSARSYGQSTDTLILGQIVDGPDPIGQIWAVIRPVPPATILNASGFARGDGPPDIKVKTVTEDPEPIGVWAYNTGTDHDIAFSEWDGNAWTPTAFLTSGVEDELDPRLAIESDGTLHVVWWTAEVSPKIYLATRPAGSSTWDPAVLVTDIGEKGRRPSVAVEDSTLRVAYERDSSIGGMAQDVVVATRQPNGSFVTNIVASTTRTERLDPTIHADQGHLWLDWKHATGEFRHSEFTGIWTTNVPESWTDETWIGVEQTRIAIRNHVVAP